jgi:hypothetical protein
VKQAKRAKQEQADVPEGRFTGMSVVFADAFYFVARLNRRDQHHQHVLQFSRDFRALDLYHQHADKKWTLTDCVSFVIMRERGVTDP